MVEESTLHVDCMNRSLSPRYLTYAYCRSKLDFLLRVGSRLPYYYYVGPVKRKTLPRTQLIPLLACCRPRCVPSSVLPRVGILIRPSDFNELTSSQNLKTTRRMSFLVSLSSVLRLSSFFLPMERRREIPSTLSEMSLSASLPG